MYTGVYLVDLGRHTAMGDQSSQIPNVVPLFAGQQGHRLLPCQPFAAIA